MSRRLTTEQFIKKAIIAHGNSFDYSKVDYKTSHEKVIIICKNNHIFEQMPNSHLNGSGCSECHGIKKLTTKDFIKKAKEVHGNTYDYSLVRYKKAQSKVEILCTSHKTFEQKAYSHLQGHGCPKCSKEEFTKAQTSNKEEFVKKAKLIHGDVYDYSEVEYTFSTNKVIIICRTHGKFLKKPNAHLNGQGCPACSGYKRKSGELSIGWTYTKWQKAGERSKHFDSFKVYIIKCWNENEEFYKIGKTFRKVKYRFRGSEKIPYNYKIIKIIEGKAREICELEKKLQKDNKEHNYKPDINFGGMHECFSEII